MLLYIIKVIVVFTLLLATSCEQPVGIEEDAAGVPILAAKPPHPQSSRKSAKYTPTAARHVYAAKVIAVDDSSLTLFLDTNCDPLDVKGWQIRQLPVADMLAKGDIHEWAGDFYAYGLADVLVGDIVAVGLLHDPEDNRVYVYEICIEERPGGLVPPSRRPGQTVHCPPNQMFAWKHGPYHIWKNVQNARPPKQAVPPPNAVPDQLPPAKQ